MFTVIRFTTTPELLPALLAVGQEMNSIRAVYDGPRARGDGFACSVSSGANWADHERAILAFVHEFAAAIVRAREIGADVTVDVGIMDPADYRWLLLVLSFSAECLRKLAASAVDLEISVYPAPTRSGRLRPLRWRRRRS